MYSMTGFGRAELKGRHGKLLVEINTLNNRFLEMSIRLPRQFSPLEAQVRQLITESIERGKVSYYLNLEEAEQVGSYKLNTAAAKVYTAQLRKLKAELKLSGDVSVTDLLSIPQVVEADKEELDYDALWVSVKKVTVAAIEKMTAMRLKEGNAMAADTAKRLKQMEKVVGKVEVSARQSVKNYSDKLKERIAELLSGPLRDSPRLEEEIALLAERTDITEECVRFRSHLEQFHHALTEKEAVGRRLNFILQEMNREVNTMGSKAADFSVTTLVISLKEELEKIREMVQNVE